MLSLDIPTLNDNSTKLANPSGLYDSAPTCSNDTFEADKLHNISLVEIPSSNSSNGSSALNSSSNNRKKSADDGKADYFQLPPNHITKEPEGNEMIVGCACCFNMHVAISQESLFE